MASFKYTSAFKKDFKRIENNSVALTRLEEALHALEKEEPLPFSFRDHKLVGRLARCRECHLRPDVLLLYEIVGDTVVLHRLGNHSELLKM